MKFKKLLIFCLFILPVLAFAQNGTIIGKITNAKTKKPVAGISIFVSELKKGAVSKKNGNFVIRNLKPGNYSVVANAMGYEKQSKKITVKSNETTKVDFILTEKSIKLKGITVSANRAKERETPIAFTNLDKKELSEKYTTEDIPDLLDNVPGVFSTNAGLGESEMYIRGFDSSKIQVLINGIPVNDPESQAVYWSNWTGLSSNAKSVQVQRGAGSSLYGSGAFGGSLNIETMDSSPEAEFTLRSSAGIYLSDEKTADGKGGMEDYQPGNYNILLKYNSGMLFDNSFSINATAERKGGSSFNNGTLYDGYSFGIEGQYATDMHKLNLSFIGSPQKHNQARKSQDIDLMKHLGRKYNRDNHDWSENSYFKPQVSLRHEWDVDDDTRWVTNYFVTRGEGGGQYMYNNEFDTQTGEYKTKDVNEKITESAKGAHADYIYKKTGVILDGYTPAITGEYAQPASFNGKAITSSKAMTGDYEHSWKNKSHNMHTQLGMNTYFKHQADENLELVAGGELRRWLADHYASTDDFNYYDPTKPNNRGIYDETQRRYDYSSIVTNASGFIRATYRYEGLSVNADGQYAIYYSEVDENPIQIFDYQTGAFRKETFYSTKNNMVLNDNGEYVKEFSDDDYNRTFKFFSPKFGINYNIDDEFNVLFNTAIAYKEPRVRDWYDRNNGPGAGQKYAYTSEGGVSIEGFEDLKPEKTQTYEVGFGYKTFLYSANINAYHTAYTDKIERITDERGTLTVNAGKATHQGIEFTNKIDLENIAWDFSATLSKNRWEKMNYDQVFGVDADEIKGKVVPFSPELMANSSISYTFDEMPLEGEFMIKLSASWWDEYYGSYSNKHLVIDYDNPDFNGEYTTLKEVDAKLPHYFSLNNSYGYKFKLGGKDASIRLDLNNILNRENYSSAYYTSDYGRDDSLRGKRHMYVLPAPDFNVFVTTEVKF